MCDDKQVCHFFFKKKKYINELEQVIYIIPIKM